MQTRSSKNWNFKSGTWDSLNTELINFDKDYPTLSSMPLTVGFEVTMCNDYKSLAPNKLVSMFIDDYVLERFWNKPLNYIERFKGCLATMTPDFSMLIGMPKPLQMFNVYRNRLVGHVWQQAGVNVIPTICWSDKSSFEYCFEGVAVGSTVAVSNTGCLTDKHLSFFDAGYSAMIDKLKPKQIIFQCSSKLRNIYQDKSVIFIDNYYVRKKEKQLWEAEMAKR